MWDRESALSQICNPLLCSRVVSAMDTDDETKRWAFGAVVPLFPLFQGVRGLIFQSFALETRGGRWVFVGAEAVTVSLACLFLAAFFHFYFFWENRERLAGYRELFVAGSLIGFLAGVAYFAYRQFAG